MAPSMGARRPRPVLASKPNLPNRDTLGANETDEINDETYAHGPAGPCYLSGSNRRTQGAHGTDEINVGTHAQGLAGPCYLSGCWTCEGISNPTRSARAR